MYKTKIADYVYILECGDGTLYTGWTTDLAGRLAAHNSGRGAKYTKPRLPVRLVYSELLADKPEALRREHAVKKLTRAQKLALIRTGGMYAPTEKVHNKAEAGGEPAIQKEDDPMNAKINREGCISCGLCAEACPAVFRMADDGLAEVCADPVPAGAESAAEEARAGCPVSVITVA